MISGIPTDVYRIKTNCVHNTVNMSICGIYCDGVLHAVQSVPGERQCETFLFRIVFFAWTTLVANQLVDGCEILVV
jgi:hypothetical protein